MSSTQDFFDILQTVTIDCKDNGECFTVTDRVAVIERMLTGSCYRLIAREPLALLYAKRELCEGDRVLLIVQQLPRLLRLSSILKRQSMAKLSLNSPIRF